jgi:aminoglycoside phosphotransferase (APT) family kinase protein
VNGSVKLAELVEKDVQVVDPTQPLLIDTALVTRLIATQFPHWADLPIQQVATDGWDNRTFHLGEDMSIRLPSHADYEPQVFKEHRWLPVLAPQLPLAIPTPVAQGVPDENYPFRWSVYRWLDGEPARPDRIRDLEEFATTLAGFLTVLQHIDAAGGPVAGAHNFYRGGPLTVYSTEVHAAIATLGDRIPGRLATEIWERALETTWQSVPVWVHGDVAVGNLLLRDGRLRAVIDFGCLGVGDPACDAVMAWTFFTGANREVFRRALGIDPGTWARARGWVLWKALITLAAEGEATSAKGVDARRVLTEIFAEYSPASRA